jgi:hypothetical protein
MNTPIPQQTALWQIRISILNPQRVKQQKHVKRLETMLSPTLLARKCTENFTKDNGWLSDHLFLLANMPVPDLKKTKDHSNAPSMAPQI